MTVRLLLDDLLDRARSAERLQAAGFGASAAEEIARLLARCARSLRPPGAPGGSRDRRASAVFAPGRIEVLGKHTDYAGGRSLLTALDRGFAVVASPRSDGRVVLTDVRGRGRLELSATVQPSSSAAWARYPAAVVARLRADFPTADRGADIAFASNLPSAAGMSSSSAFVTATFLALAALNGVERNERFRAAIPGVEALADYLGAVENGRPYGRLAGAGAGAGVGTRGGSQDHVAILCARPGQLVQYAFRPVRLERALPIPDGWTFVVASSGVRAAKGGAAGPLYNRISDLAARLEAIGQEGTAAKESGNLGDILASAPDALDRLRSRVRTRGAADAEALLERLEHFAAEALEIIPAAGDALASGELTAFGVHVDRSQRLAERALHNQVKETIHLQRGARELGAPAASAFGAGFGGSVWALVADGDAADFIERWREDYLASFPRRRASSAFMLAPPGPAAVRF